jgi:hypothetical protein
MWDNYRTESLEFDGAYIVLPYNAILGYPALAKFMAATHHGFNVLKIPGAHGTITVSCNEKDALCSVEHVYSEVATMYPADEDLLEHSGDLTRKKQLMSQERAAAKRALLEPLVPGLSGRKPTLSPAAEPSEDLVNPILDMSIGGSCNGFRKKAAIHSRALRHQEGPAEGWGLRELPHHRGRAFSQIGKRACHLPVGKL